MSLKDELKKLDETTKIPEGWETLESIALKEGLSDNWTRIILRKLVKAGKYEQKRFSRKPTLHYRKID